jgi:hypothetical protein
VPRAPEARLAGEEKEMGIDRLSDD